MALNFAQMKLSAADAADLDKANNNAVNEFLALEQPRANLVGVATGIKWSNGKPTGKPAVLALVTHKVDKSELPKEDLIPEKLNGAPTDVLAIGQPFAGQAQPVEVGIELLARKVRPAGGGYSIGHIAITAGTLGSCVYDLPGTPGNPSGVPSNYYILSNNHVLAASNAGMPGDPILQPGPFDGGTNPGDAIARLNRFIPITFDPPVPRALHRNFVDAAVAKGEFHDLNREIHWLGYLQGWLPRADVSVGMLVHKTGRTTNYTTGRVVAINATIDVNYGGGRVARFRDQIVTTAMSAGGDSGSIVATRDNKAVGLLFAGSPIATIINQIQHVRSLLQVEIA